MPTVKELKSKLRDLGLSTQGKKAELMKRIEANQQQQVDDEGGSSSPEEGSSDEAQESSDKKDDMEIEQHEGDEEVGEDDGEVDLEIGVDEVVEVVDVEDDGEVDDEGGSSSPEEGSSNEAQESSDKEDDMEIEQHESSNEAQESSDKKDDMEIEQHEGDEEVGEDDGEVDLEVGVDEAVEVVDVEDDGEVDDEAQKGGSNPIKEAVWILHHANQLDVQLDVLPEHLKDLLIHPIPHLDDTPSVAFIASSLWFGNQHEKLKDEVQEKCFHSDEQGRRIIGVVQAYGCGKTKTALRLSEFFILLPIRFTVDLANSNTFVDHVVKAQTDLLNRLPREPTLQEMQAFTVHCQRLVHLFLFSFVALYDHCDCIGVFNDYDEKEGRFYFAVLLLHANTAMITWCRDYYDKHKKSVIDGAAFKKLRDQALEARGGKIVFLFDEVQVLFDKCRGYVLHAEDTPTQTVSEWRNEQINGHPAQDRAYCTDLFYQFRLVMLSSMRVMPSAPFGFVMCSTMFRIWNMLEVENSPLSRGTIEQFFNLHWFTHADIKKAVLTFFKIEPSFVEALEQAPDGSILPPHRQLSAFNRPLFLMEFLENLCKDFKNLKNALPDTITQWLRCALNSSLKKCMNRARDKIRVLVQKNTAADVFTSRSIIHLLYAVQRLCGGTLNLSPNTTDNEKMLESIIGNGVAHIDSTESSRFRISDPIFVDALVNQYVTKADQHNAVIKILAMNSNFQTALVSQDSGHKGFLVERVLAWLALSGQLNVPVHDQPATVTWTVAATATTAGTISELGLGTTSADEPEVVQGIMEGKYEYLLLPTTLAGPDLWMQAQVNGVECMVALQSKVENKVYTIDCFQKALHSLNPSKMYKHPKAKAAKAKWKPVMELLAQRPYHRIVFNACGFAEEVQYYVREYNQDRGSGGHPSRFIHLLSLDDIKEQMGQGLYNSIKSQVNTAIQKTMGDKDMLLASEWKLKCQTDKKKSAEKDVHKFCRQRGISVYSPTSHRKKRKVVLVEELSGCSLDNKQSKMSHTLTIMDATFAFDEDEQNTTAQGQ